MDGQQGTHQQKETKSTENGSFRITGTVRYQKLEGGFWSIEGDDGGHYAPSNLPRAFSKEGMRVEITAKPVTDRISFQMWGRPIEIIEAKQLAAPERRLPKWSPLTPGGRSPISCHISQKGRSLKFADYFGLFKTVRDQRLKVKEAIKEMRALALKKS